MMSDGGTAWQRRARLLAASIALGAAAARAAPDPPKPSKPSKPKLASPAELARCVDAWGPEPCMQALQEYVKARPDQAFEAGRVVTRSFAHWAAIPFFDEALAARADVARCKDERLALAVASALGQPNDYESGTIVASAATILGQRCWNELQPGIARQLAKDARGTFTDNVCPIFASKNQSPRACWPRAPGPSPRAPAAEWEDLDPEKIRVEDTASVYSGADGRRITIAKVKDEPYYLIKFQGVRGAWNGKVVIHRQDAASSGFDFWTPVHGRRYVSVVVRNPRSPSALWEVHPPGAKSAFRVTLDAAASKAVKPQKLLAELAR